MEGKLVDIMGMCCIVDWSTLHQQTLDVLNLFGNIQVGSPHNLGFGRHFMSDSVPQFWRQKEPFQVQV